MGRPPGPPTYGSLIRLLDRTERKLVRIAKEHGGAVAKALRPIVREIRLVLYLSGKRP